MINKFRRGEFIKLLTGAAILFVTFAVVICVSVIIYALAEEKFGKNPTVMFFIMFADVAFFAITCTAIDLFRRKITESRPSRQILDATDKIAKGDFTVRLKPSHPYSRYDEYDYIKENLNKMAAELSKNEVLKNDFISNVSHEMKTPLAVIQSYASALRDGKLDEQTRASYAKTLTEETRRLNYLVTNILKLNKLENSAIKQDARKVRLDEVLSSCVVNYEESISDKGLELYCDICEAEAYSQPDYLEIVFNNLLSNAVKFTEAGGKIGVYLTVINGKAIIKITDTGCGIPSETGERIFDKFYQGDTSHAKEGNGLGLALVKKVIDLIGGEIKVESEPGKGSEFSVILNGEKI